MAQKDYQIEQLDSPAWDVIGQAINDYNEQQAGDDHAKRLCYVVKSAAGEIVGGVIGITYWDWLSVDLMWVRADLRGRGYGQRLLDMIEEAGRRQGAKYAFLDTFSFQAPGFYEKQGYRVFGALEGFPSGQTRYYMTKAL